MGTDTEKESKSTPSELKFEDKDALKWGAFIFFMALTPFIVILVPKIAGPVILFGAVIFCAVFLFSDQKSNLVKNANKLWQAKDEREKIELSLDVKEENNTKHFFFLFESPPEIFKTKAFFLNTCSDGALDELEKIGEDDKFFAELVYSKEIDDLILIFIDSHRFWCRPWNYPIDYSQEYNSFEQENSSKK